MPPKDTTGHHEAGTCRQDAASARMPGKPAVQGRVKVRVGARTKAREVWLAPGESFRDFDTAPEMVVVPPGSFMMGSTQDEGADDERPRHEVTIPNALTVGKFPITFAEWDAYAEDIGKKGTPVGRWGRGPQPVINVGWDDVQDYLCWLSWKAEQEYRLLSEAEWEYCCRAGDVLVFPFGDITKCIERSAWYSGNSGGRTHPVGQKASNDFGLYDMGGNVWEWCEDTWHDSYELKPECLKPAGGAWITKGSDLHVVRGGSWDSHPGYLRAASRNWSGTGFWDTGFRVARSISQPAEND